jgi:hypothetical protein
MDHTDIPVKYIVLFTACMERGKPSTFLTTKLAKTLIGWGYRWSTADFSTFYRLAPDNVRFVVLVITVDDFCSARNSEAYLEQC